MQQPADTAGWLQTVLTHEHLWGNIESIVKIIAIAVGAWWTYSLFIRQRQRFPRASVAHTIIHRVVPGATRVVQVALEIKNTGVSLLQIESIDIRLQHVAPIAIDGVGPLTTGDALDPTAKSIIPWRLIGHRTLRYDLGDREIEPGESDFVHCDLVIPDASDAVRLYSHICNVRKRQRWKGLRRVPSAIGWQHVTYHDISRGGPVQVEPEADETAAQSPHLPAPATNRTPTATSPSTSTPEVEMSPAERTTRSETRTREAVPQQRPEEVRQTQPERIPDVRPQTIPEELPEPAQPKPSSGDS